MKSKFKKKITPKYDAYLDNFNQEKCLLRKRKHRYDGNLLNALQRSGKDNSETVEQRLRRLEKQKSRDEPRSM